MKENLDLVIAEFLIGVEETGVFDFQGLCDQHPELESDIRRFFEMQKELFKGQADAKFVSPLEYGSRSADPDVTQS